MYYNCNSSCRIKGLSWKYFVIHASIELIKIINDPKNNKNQCINDCVDYNHLFLIKSLQSSEGRAVRKVRQKNPDMYYKNNIFF